MKEAVIIFLVGLILGTNYVHGATNSDLRPMIEKSEQLVNYAIDYAPAGWPGMNLIAEIQNMQDQLNAALSTATPVQSEDIRTELRRLDVALKLLNAPT